MRWPSIRPRGGGRWRCIGVRYAKRVGSSLRFLRVGPTGRVLKTKSSLSACWTPRLREVASRDVCAGYGRCIPRVAQAKCVTDQQMMGLHTIHLLDLSAAYL